MNNCSNCYNKQRMKPDVKSWCFYKKAEPILKCWVFYPVSARFNSVIKIDRGQDMQERLQKIWSSLGCEVVDRLGASRHIIKNGVTLVSGGYQNELQYLRINYPRSLNG